MSQQSTYQFFYESTMNPFESLLQLCWISIRSPLDLDCLSVISIGSPLDISWICIRYLLDHLWISVGSLWDSYWISIGSPSDLYWISIGLPLDLCWISIGYLLDLHWIFFGFLSDINGSLLDLFGFHLKFYLLPNEFLSTSYWISTRSPWDLYRISIGSLFLLDIRWYSWRLLISNICLPKSKR